MRLPLIALALTGTALAGPAAAQMHRWTPPDGVRQADYRGFHQHWHGQPWQGQPWQGRPHRPRFRSFDLNTGAAGGPAAAPEPPGLMGVAPPGLASGSGNGNGNRGSFNGNNNTGNNNGNGNVGNGLGNGFSTNGNENGIVP